MSRYSIILILLWLWLFPCAVLAGPDRTPDILDNPRFLKTVVVNGSEETSPGTEAVSGEQKPTTFASDATFTPTPTRIPTSKKFEKASSKTQGSRLPQVTTIPNPAWGKKMTFRIMAEGAVDVRIQIYNRNLDPIDELKKTGMRYFDILWNLTFIPEGIYYYQTQIADKESGKITNFPVQKFVVLKKEEIKQKKSLKTGAKPNPAKKP